MDVRVGRLSKVPGRDGASVTALHDVGMLRGKALVEHRRWVGRSCIASSEVAVTFSDALVSTFELVMSAEVNEVFQLRDRPVTASVVTRTAARAHALVSRLER